MLDIGTVDLLDGIEARHMRARREPRYVLPTRLTAHVGRERGLGRVAALVPQRAVALRAGQ